MSDFRKKLREYAAEEIGKPGEHKRQEIADRFLDAYPVLASDYMRELAARKVAELIKELCDEPIADPLPIFDGFPAAIAVSPGVVKATGQCVLDDLGAGLAYRQKNIDDATKARDRFRDSMTVYESLRASETETVGQCQDRLRKQGPKSPA